jgi:PIN domain nuclease of toxin-antitoxin system
MNCLVDTHVLIWSFIDPDKLDNDMQKALLDEESNIYYSQFSLWEISIKYALGKLTLNGLSLEGLYGYIDESFFICSPLKNEELASFYRLPVEHKDPFDRALVWQAISNNFTFISVDKKMDMYQKHGLKLL